MFQKYEKKYITVWEKVYPLYFIILQTCSRSTRISNFTESNLRAIHTRVLDYRLASHGRTHLNTFNVTCIELQDHVSHLRPTNFLCTNGRGQINYYDSFIRQSSAFRWKYCENSYRLLHVTSPFKNHYANNACWHLLITVAPEASS